VADWTELDTNGLLPGEPFTSAKAMAVFENPKAIAEGADDTPRNQLKSLPRLVAGSSVRSTRTRTVPVGTSEIILNYGIIQIGTIRASMTREAGAGTGSVTISRIRSGTSVTLATTTTAASITADVSVIPGDALICSGGAVGGPRTHSATLAVASGDLWPSITGGYLEGNNV